MPSGAAKRRKAAKRKKEQLATQEGNGDSKSYDEKDSDSGSVSSPTTSHEHQNPLRKDQGKSFEVVGDTGDTGEDLVETKEVDFETRVIDIEAVKEPYVDFESRVVNIEERLNGNTSNEVPKMEELSESKDGVEKPVLVVETVEVNEPVGEVVSVTEEVVVNPVKEVIQGVDEVNPAEKSGDSSSQLKDVEEKMLPQLNDRSVETSNGNGDRKESHVTLSSDNQQKEVATVPPTVRPTSWKSCCGLFDVLAGSDR
ncbi:hypothetical protein IFM89_020031 [Coptis chinensis]|uniref:Uncharacterized protein n=1 Tax=Coptis chinensis TaxID=261450 RepID=A0A835IRJ9_9MAGN|nr:hypothetical protein IFM89_020031 [Coptis chinensis]